MKRVNTIAIGFALLSFVISAKGQTEKGKIIIGGDTKLDFSILESKWKSDNGSGNFGTTTSFELSPKLGYFVIDNLALGVILPYKYSLEKDDSDNKYSSSTFAFEPFARYYFGSSNTKPYLQGGAGLGLMTMKNMPALGSSDKVNAEVFLYQIGGGVAVFLNERVSLDFGVGYSSTSVKNKENNSNGSRIIQSGLELGIGFTILF